MKSEGANPKNPKLTIINLLIFSVVLIGDVGLLDARPRFKLQFRHQNENISLATSSQLKKFKGK